MDLIKIQKAIDKFSLRKNVSNIQVGIYNNGVKTYLSNQTVQPNAIYQIGSITKVFTTLSILIAIKEQKLKLTTTLDILFPNSKLNNSIAKITVWEMLMHQSGLPSLPSNFLPKMENNPTNPYADITKNDILYYLENAPLHLNKKFNYSNFAYGLLSMIIENIYNENFEKVLEEKILHPLNMNETCMDKNKLKNGQLVNGYNLNGELTSTWDLPFLLGAGAIFSSTFDMLKFIEGFFQPNTISDTMTKTFEIQTKRMTFGFHRSGLLMYFSGLKDVLWHNGGTGGCTSYLAIRPKTKCGFIVLSNSAKIADELGILITTYL